MNLVHENLFRKIALPAMYVVTTNSTVRRDGALVMGRGAALELKSMLPGIEFICGRRVSGNQDYGFLEIRTPSAIRAGIGIFQVKHFYGDNAEFLIISSAARKLRAWMLAHPDVQVRMNFPGIGNGQLKREHVLPFLTIHLEDMDMLTICER